MDPDRHTFTRHGRRGGGDPERICRRPCLSGLRRVQGGSRLRGGRCLRFRDWAGGSHRWSLMQHLARAAIVATLVIEVRTDLALSPRFLVPVFVLAFSQALSFARALVSKPLLSGFPCLFDDVLLVVVGIAHHVRPKESSFFALGVPARAIDTKPLWFLSNPKHGHTTFGSGRSAWRSGRMGSGKIGCQQNHSPSNKCLPVESKTRTHNGRVGSARRRADGGAGRRWSKQGADILVALEANRPSGLPAQCKKLS